MRILVCGSRTWRNIQRIHDELVAVGATYVLHGGASGADHLAHEAAVAMKLPVEVYPAWWGQYGNAAGPIRNQQMLTEGKPDIVLAFWDGKSRGTADMIAKAQAAKVPTRIILEFEA